LTVSNPLKRAALTVLSPAAAKFLQISVKYARSITEEYFYKLTVSPKSETEVLDKVTAERLTSAWRLREDATLSLKERLVKYNQEVPGLNLTKD
jgi:hypothetical protein